MAGTPIVIGSFAAVTASATDSGQYHIGAHQAVWFFLDITAHTGAGGVIDVYVQSLVDTTNWVDTVSFTTATGVGRQRSMVQVPTTQPPLVLAGYSPILTNGTALQYCAPNVRVRYAITAATVTFRVIASVIH